MSRRRVPMLLAALILSAGAFAAPASAAAAAADAAPSPGCQRLKEFGTLNASNFGLTPDVDFYAGEVVTLTVDFQYDTNIAHVSAVLLPVDGPAPEREWATLSAPHRTISWEITTTGRWSFNGYLQPTVEDTWPATADFTYKCDTLVLSAFEAPVDVTPIINVAQAGRTIPFKFTVADHYGNPVTDLTTDDVTPVNHLSVGACGTTGNVSPIEAYSSGDGTLTHLGDGRYVYTLKTHTAWRGTCGSVGVRVRNVEKSAAFQFHS